MRLYQEKFQKKFGSFKNVRIFAPAFREKNESYSQ